MKRLAITAGLGLALAALSAGTAMAGCPDHVRDFPESQGWTAVDDTSVVPAGYACDVAVTLRVVGHEKVTINGKPPTGDPQPGDLIKSVAPDERVTVTNNVTGRTITRKIDGTFYDRVLDDGNFRSRGVGRNLYLGPGVEGLLWTDGVQRFNVDVAASRVEFTAIKGKAVDLCAKVGARPVAGQLPPESTT